MTRRIIDHLCLLLIGYAVGTAIMLAAYYIIPVAGADPCALPADWPTDMDMPAPQVRPS